MNMENLNEIIKNIVIEKPWLIPLFIWLIIWKMIALWKSARNNHLIFFIVVMFLNTLGILEIGYILYLYITKSKKIKS